MKEIYGDLWDMPMSSTVDAICITTNGFIKHDGTAVMGKGCAKEYVERVPNAPRLLAEALQTYGNRPNILSYDDVTQTHVLSFPVKPVGDRANANLSNVVKHMRSRFKPGDWVPGWACVADPRIIANSALELKQLADKYRWAEIVIPRPGCGAGELNWDALKPRLSSILDDDRFLIITKGE